MNEIITATEATTLSPDFKISYHLITLQLLILHDQIGLLHKEHGQLSEKRNSRNINNEFVYRVKLRELQNACKVRKKGKGLERNCSSYCVN